MLTSTEKAQKEHIWTKIVPRAAGKVKWQPKLRRKTSILEEYVLFQSYDFHSETFSYNFRNRFFYLHICRMTLVNKTAPFLAVKNQGFVVFSFLEFITIRLDFGFLRMC